MSQQWHLAEYVSTDQCAGIATCSCYLSQLNRIIYTNWAIIGLCHCCIQWGLRTPPTPPGHRQTVQISDRWISLSSSSFVWGPSICTLQYSVLRKSNLYKNRGCPYANIRIVACRNVTLCNGLGGYKLSRRAYVLHFEGSKFGLTCENNYLSHSVPVSKATCLCSLEFLKPDSLTLLP